LETTYLDHAATTPMRAEAVAAMLPFLTDNYGNPSGSHSVSRAARKAVDDARDSLARDLACDPGEIVFTSGGTESNNLAVLGATARASGPGSVVCCAVEHHSVLGAVESKEGTIVGVDGRGVVDLAALEEALSPSVRLVSVMLANNEVGTVEPLSDVARITRERAPGALVHTDAVAAVACLDAARLASCADLVSISAHKFGGPKGIGALLVRSGARLGAVLHGGEQERGRRPGTQHVAGIVGMAAALGVVTAEREVEAERIGALRDRLSKGILASLEGATESTAAETVPSIFNARFAGIEAEDLLLLLDQAGICASAGAACASGALDPSHVLVAMGCSNDEARSAVRFSLGWTTTAADVDHTIEVVPKLVEQLRS
jgi:cysteine desulfurase